MIVRRIRAAAKQNIQMTNLRTRYGLASDTVTGIAGFGSTIITTHFGDGLSLINLSTANPSITTFGTNVDIDSVFLNDVASIR